MNPFKRRNHNFFFKISSLLSKGRQILMKDNLIDEERAKQEEAAQESLEQKLERLGKKNECLQFALLFNLHYHTKIKFALPFQINF